MEQILGCFSLLFLLDEPNIFRERSWLCHRLPTLHAKLWQPAAGRGPVFTGVGTVSIFHFNSRFPKSLSLVPRNHQREKHNTPINFELGRNILQELKVATTAGIFKEHLQTEQKDLKSMLLTSLVLTNQAISPKEASSPFT